MVNIIQNTEAINASSLLFSILILVKRTEKIERQFDISPLPMPRLKNRTLLPSFFSYDRFIPKKKVQKKTIRDGANRLFALPI
jgi:hypothetical protein